MVPPSQKPAVLIVHGSWHIPEHYALLSTALTNAGFLTICPRHPSMNGDKPGTKNLSDDVTNLQFQAADLVNKGHPLLVLCHSYGGIVTTNALTEDLAYAKRQEKGLPGGIVSLIYLCAFLPQIGGSISSIVDWSATRLRIDVDEQGDASVINPIEAFYHDVPKELADKSVAMLLTHPGICHTTPVTHVAWKYFPVTYIYCENDQALVPQFQQSMIKAAQDAGILALRTETSKASHSPFLSMPDETAAAVERSWQANIPAGYPEASA